MTARLRAPLTWGASRLPAGAAETLIWLLLLAVTGLPRVLALGGLPTTDEGVYAYHAQWLHAHLVAHGRLPDDGTLMLYPLLVSWIYALHGNALVLLRLVDLAVALLASRLLYSVVRDEAGSRLGGVLISAVFLLTMNLPIFVQSGFKNSIFAAYVPLFLAMRLIQRGGVSPPWARVGACVVLSVLLRETFIPFLLVAAAGVWLSRDWRSTVRFCGGAATAGVSVMGAMLLSRGGSAPLLDAYREAGAMYAAVAGQRAQLLADAATASTQAAWATLALGALAAVALLARLVSQGRAGKLAGRAIFWLAIMSVPLLEPLSKIGFPYHFAVCLPGLAGLVALGWRAFAVDAQGRGGRWLAPLCTTMALLSLLPGLRAQSPAWPASHLVLAHVGSPEWPSSTIPQSQYLLAAMAIRHALPAGATVSVSGFMMGLYPLSGRLPPSRAMSNLTVTLIALGMDEQRLVQALRDCPADLLMTTDRTDWPGAVTLNKAVRESGLYEQVVQLPVRTDIHYGTFAGTVFRLKPPLARPCNGAVPDV